MNIVIITGFGYVSNSSGNVLATYCNNPIGTTIEIPDGSTWTDVANAQSLPQVTVTADQQAAQAQNGH